MFFIWQYIATRIIDKNKCVQEEIFSLYPYLHNSPTMRIWNFFKEKTYILCTK